MTQSVEARRDQDGYSLDYVPAAAVTAGTVIQLADGRAGVPGNDIAAGGTGSVRVEGVYRVPKTSGVVLLDGGRVYWDTSASAATFRATSGQQDFYLGLCVGDAAATAAYCFVRINVEPCNAIELHRGLWTVEETDGLGVTQEVGGSVLKLAFDAVAEVAQAALLSGHGVPVAAKPILRARLAVHDIGNAAALDISAGLASGSHATDFQSVAEFVAIHFDGSALDIKVQSDDGTTDVAPVDSDVDAVDDTEFELWIDCRDLDDVRVYIDGVDVVPSGTTLALTAASGPLYPIVHLEKTSDDTTADVRVSVLEVRTAG